MKKIYKTNWLLNRKTVALLAGLFLTAGAAMAQMTGTYTLDSSAASSLTTKNFQSFNDLADSLDTYGVGGAVTVNVVAASGPYNEQVTFGVISGASSTNTITINGNGETISSNVSYVIELNGTDYLTIDDLHIVAAGTVSQTRGVWIHNTANYNTISNCDIEFSAYTSTSNASAYVMFSASETSHSSGNHGMGNSIVNNYMHGTSNSYGPYYGVDIYGSGSGNNLNTVSGNDIRDVYYYYVYAYYANDLQVTNNDLHHQRSGTSYTYAVYAYYCDAVTRDMSFDNNDMRNFTATYFYGTYFYYCDGGSTYKVTQRNNDMFSINVSSYLYGYRVGQSSQVEVIDNTMDGCKSGGYIYYAMYNYYNNNAVWSGNEITNNTAGTYFYYPSYQYYSNNCTVQNNLISGNTAGSYFYYGLYYMYYCNNMTFDHNEVSNNSCTYYFYCSYNYQGSNVNITNNVLSGNSCGYYMYYGFMTQYINGGSLVNNVNCNNKGDYGFLYGIYNAYCNDFVIAHNTLDVNYDMDYYYYGMYIYYYNTPVNIEVKNNIMNIDASPGYGYSYPIYCYYNADLIDWGYNVFKVNQPGTQYWYANSSTYSNFPSWAAVAEDYTSIVADPMFVNRTGCDLTPTNPVIANMGQPGYATYDITGATRTACGPDPGAYEFFIDHDVANLVFTGTNECGNYSEPITIDFNNGSSVAMTDVEMFYTINGANKVTEYIPSVSAYGSETFTFSTVPVFNTPGVNTIEAGLGCDDDVSNNTLTHQITITPSPSGGNLTEGSTFDGYFRDGTMGNPDIAVPNTTSVYDIMGPSKYTPAQYGSMWTITDNSMTAGGSSVAALGVTMSAANMTFTVDPDPSLVDSMIYVSFTINDLATNCDSVVGRWLYVPHTPEVDFTLTGVCLGDVARFKNKSTMGGSNFMLYKWRYNDPNSNEDTSEAKDGFWQYTTYGTFDVTLEVVNQTYPKFVYTVTKQVVVTPTPDIDFSIVNACEGIAIQFNNNTTIPTGSGTTNIIYAWDFGDGSTSTLEDPTHMYATPKATGFPVTLKATANGCSSTLTKTAYQFAKPVANFSSTGACNLEEIQFNNLTTLAIGKSGYTWDFGDNGISTVKDPTHVYSNSGTHTVTLTAYSEFGCEDDITIDVTLLESPEADFTYDATCNLTPVNFTRTGSVPSGIASDFQWDFNGEGSSSSENPTFLFSEVGTKTVTLTISSLNGCTSTTTQELDVVLQAVADFEASDICEGEEAVFNNKSSVAAGDLTYTWLFGAMDIYGNTTSTLVKPRHRYASTGVTRIVNVTLIAEVEGGCDAQITKPITINAAPDANFTEDVQGRTVVLDAPSGYTIYQWRFGDGASSSDEDPVYTYENVDQGEFEICLSVKNDDCWSENCETVLINLLSVEDLTSKDDMINVYPNPSTGVFNLTVENASNVEIAVSDILGNVLPISITDNLNGNYTVDMSKVADGVYFVQVKNGDYYATKRITVSK